MVRPGVVPEALSFFTLHIKQLFGSTVPNGKGVEHLELPGVDAVEAAEAQIDAFISKRAKEREEANRLEAAWAETVAWLKPIRHWPTSTRSRRRGFWRKSSRRRET
jgi:hypothetical protein